MKNTTQLLSELSLIICIPTLQFLGIVMRPYDVTVVFILNWKSTSILTKQSGSFIKITDKSQWEDFLCFSNSMDTKWDNTREHFIWVCYGK